MRNENLNIASLHNRTYTDGEVVSFLQNGQLSYYEMIIRKYNSTLYRIGRTFNLDHETTTELMQNTYIDVFEYIRKNSKSDAVRIILVNTMIKNCYQQINKNKLQNNFSQKNSIAMKVEVKNKELNKIVEQVIENIPLDQRVAYTLAEMNQYNKKEVAKILSIDEAEVIQRIKAAKESIRTELEKLYSPKDLFEFNLIYCDTMVNNVMQKIYKHE